MSDESRRRTISVDEAAIELGIGRNAAYQAVKDGLIPSIRIGRKIVVPRVAFDRMFEHSEQGAPAAAE